MESLFGKVAGLVWSFTKNAFLGVFLRIFQYSSEMLFYQTLEYYWCCLLTYTEFIEFIYPQDHIIIYPHHHIKYFSGMNAVYGYLLIKY